MGLINKRGFEFSFGWLFALIAGAVIIFLAIYAASKIASQQTQRINTENAKQFEILLYPTGTGLDESKISVIPFPMETSFTFACDPAGPLGFQVINTEDSSSIAAQSRKKGISARTAEKFIFSPTTFDSKELIVFVKPFYLPFKIADLIIIIPKEKRYCFIEPPTEVRNDISSLRSQHPLFNSSIIIASKDQCPKDSERICFQFKDRTCNVAVFDDKIIRGDKIVYTIEGEEGLSLLYAAIFADANTYECQVKRLMKRASEIASVYINKENIFSSAGCHSGLDIDLINYINLTKSFNNTALDLGGINRRANDIADRNKWLSCKLF